MNQQHFEIDNKGKISWLTNPIEVLNNTYHFLNMDYESGCKNNYPAASMIWDHDQEILSDAIAFYDSLAEHLDSVDFTQLSTSLKAKRHKAFDADMWTSIQAAHKGYQAGCEILSLLPYLAHCTGFFDLCVKEDLSINIPEHLFEKDFQVSMAKVLVPPPVAKSDEILASSGGMFYASEAPGMPPFVEEGSHFETGQALYIVEVMKMFNKINAPFSGTIAKVLIEEDGTIIKKGQPLFKIVPDEKVIIESPEEIQARKAKATESFLKQLA